MTPNTLSLRSIVDVILFIGPDERALNLISTLQFARKNIGFQRRQETSLGQVECNEKIPTINFQMCMTEWSGVWFG